MRHQDWNAVVETHIRAAGGDPRFVLKSMDEELEKVAGLLDGLARWGGGVAERIAAKGGVWGATKSGIGNAANRYNRWVSDAAHAGGKAGILGSAGRGATLGAGLLGTSAAAGGALAAGPVGALVSGGLGAAAGGLIGGAAYGGAAAAGAGVRAAGRGWRGLTTAFREGRSASMAARGVNPNMAGIAGGGGAPLIKLPALPAASSAATTAERQAATLVQHPPATLTLAGHAPTPGPVVAAAGKVPESGIVAGNVGKAAQTPAAISGAPTDTAGAPLWNQAQTMWKGWTPGQQMGAAMGAAAVPALGAGLMMGGGGQRGNTTIIQR